MPLPAHRLLDPAIGVVVGGAASHRVTVTTTLPTPIADGLDELRDRLRAAATEDGVHLLPHPDLVAFRASAPLSWARQHTPTITVVVVADRRKHLRLQDGQRFTYTRGSYLCCTREMHYEAAIPEATRRRPYLSLGVRLRPELVAETVLALADAGDDDQEVDAYVGDLDVALLDSFLRLVRAVDDPVDARLLAPLVIRELVVRLLRAELARPLRRAAQTDDGRILEAMRFIREHAHERLTVDQIAKQVAMSASHFAHRFSEVARMSPMRYAKQQRLRRARTLLLGDRRVSEVALEVGYQSPAQFARDFKANFGLPPLAYAQRNRDRVSPN